MIVAHRAHSYVVLYSAPSFCSFILSLHLLFTRDNLYFLIQAATLFSRICGRQPRTLQLCITMLERCFKTNKRLSSKEEECRLLTTIGEILSLQGPAFVDKASNIFREATKRDPQNPAPLLGLIRLQIVEGAMDEAESQIELLGLMHNLEDLGYEMLFIQALLPNTAAPDNNGGGGRNAKNQQKQVCSLLLLCFFSLLC